MHPDAHRSRGFTLMELLLLIVVFAIGISGILTVYANTVLASADPLVRKQARAIAESMMEEVLLQAFDIGDGKPGGVGLARDQFNEVSDYSGYSTTTGVVNIYGNAIANLSAYNVSVTVADGPINTVAGADSKLVTVTVIGPGNARATVSGYKLRYP